eukprot:GFYU01007049.1.p1 GENE.GFYU01007049.1~~GFYU01007049.1.p1  ORF type:complete len:342 (+),score=81.05 GFYU01007049.1:22-1026(+)
MTTQYQSTLNAIEETEQLISTLETPTNDNIQSQWPQVSGMMQRWNNDVSPAMTHMKTKADEPDPDRRMYGPKMVEKVLNLYTKYSEALVVLEERYSLCEPLWKAHEEKENNALNAVKEREAELERERLREEERARAEAEALRLKEEAEAAEKLKLEQEQQEILKQRELEREQRNAERHKRNLESNPQPIYKWYDEPFDPAAGELTIELAIALEDNCAKQTSALSRALTFLAKNMPDQKTHLEVLRTLCMYIRNIINDPKMRETRRIRRENELFQDKLGQYKGGVECLLACGFVEQVESKGNMEDEEIWLVMNRVVVDDLQRLLKQAEAAYQALR